MILDGRSLADVSLDDIQSLIDDRVPESCELDYKETPYSGRPSDIREMLRDIAALANADGGYIVLGVREDGMDRPVEMIPFEDPRKRAEAMRRACLDGIRERIDGLEIVAYEKAFNQGIIVIHVPRSELCPHMVTRDHRTDFYRRYDTDKVAMTIDEIRRKIIAGPYARRFEESLEMVEEEPGEKGGGVEGVIPPYARVITERPVERFLQKYLLGGVSPQTLVIVSPFIGDLEGSHFKLDAVTEKADADGTRLFVITREPRDLYHEKGIEVLRRCPMAEIRYDPDIHAKLYVAWCRDEDESFALFGSGNLTESGLGRNIELGMMIFARGHGRSILRELYNWGSVTLRSRNRPVKAISAN